MGELTLIRPVSQKMGSKFGDRNGTHYGIDFGSGIGTPVKASESGLVVRAAFNGTKEKPQYGNVIIIDHTPGAEKNEPHIYTLYAHLKDRGYKVAYGDKVEKGQEIGLSGNTGKVFSSTGGDGAHLHFDVISSPNRMAWGKTGATGFHKNVNRVNPSGYFGCLRKVDGTLTDMVESAIVDRMEFVPDIDFGRNDPFRMGVWLDGKYLGDMKDIRSVIRDINYDFKRELHRLH